MNEIIIGRQGEQKMSIAELSVSRKHCKVTALSGGRYLVEDLSKFGTFVNGKKITSSIASENDTIGLGPAFSAKLSDLIVPKAVSSETARPQEFVSQPVPSKSFDLVAVSRYITYKDVLKDFKRMSDLESLWAAVGNQPSFPAAAACAIQCAIACKHLRGGKFAEAQKIIYKAGDHMYSILDGTSVLECGYASMMTLLADLYLSTFNYVEAEKAAGYAVGIYNRWKPDDEGMKTELVAEACERYADALVHNDNKALAARGYARALELYRMCGSSQPELYSAKIKEIEHKVDRQGLPKSKASISSNFPRCATCLYWCGHTEPNVNCSLVYYTPGEWAQCTKTFRGSSTGQPADQSCSNWEQRYR